MLRLFHRSPNRNYLSGKSSFRLALFANDGLFEMSVPFPDTKAIEGVSLLFCVPLSANVSNSGRQLFRTPRHWSYLQPAMGIRELFTHSAGFSVRCTAVFPGNFCA